MEKTIKLLLSLIQPFEIKDVFEFFKENQINVKVEIEITI